MKAVAAPADMCPVPPRPASPDSIAAVRHASAVGRERIKPEQTPIRPAQAVRQGHILPAMLPYPARPVRRENMLPAREIRPARLARRENTASTREAHHV